MAREGNEGLACFKVVDDDAVIVGACDEFAFIIEENYLIHGLFVGGCDCSFTCYGFVVKR